ncbi:tetratricopeptide repeat protein [Polyangium jinanense]|uniref:Tetratricopeptide repeat protein n=1 Tax=Polyangium jinanense TaxID=2829994 RepID=A0A9X4AV83_9BACT|nr:tetratricopeptide repeat protein [Polyangium jinanense]MDC3959057.1 tetratricopeptide repeat protein [Polyangium jinanense]MDC3984020.1 tetratricopeptide repeat protein [Polyangium jinanense]
MARPRKPSGASAWPFSIACAALLAAPVAHAQQDPAAAEALFNRGLVAMQAGHFHVACPAFAESQRLDPRAGTLFTLAECERLSGKIASASAHYAEYLRLFDGMPAPLRQKHAERATIARKEKAAIDPTIPTLTLVLPQTAPPGTRVTRDGIELGAASLGTALPVDPGEHLLTTWVPGTPPIEQRVIVAQGEAKTVALDVQATTPTRPAGSTSFPPILPTDPHHPEPPEHAYRGVPTWAWVAGLGGLAAASGSIVFTVSHLHVRGLVAERCPDGTCVEPGLAAEYRRLWNRDLGLAIGFGALGALGIGAAITGIVRASPEATKVPHAAAFVPWVTKGAGGAAVVGHF